MSITKQLFQQAEFAGGFLSSVDHQAIVVDSRCQAVGVVADTVNGTIGKISHVDLVNAATEKIVNRDFDLAGVFQGKRDGGFGVERIRVGGKHVYFGGKEIGGFIDGRCVFGIKAVSLIEKL